MSQTLKPDTTYNRFGIWDSQAERFKDEILVEVGGEKPAAREGEEVIQIGTATTGPDGEIVETTP
ncbi:hypothetical protein HBA54_27635 [Pelagibius litoralis]|uniref:Uncharacterized protein n=1 Tax=Pelagibius litoralis TaxID=374515 RepID=A0A967F3E4_9PROT|nr:hypothetical protein [Pelagibius litoralis]NIA72365.1 hypothetical protein [Pelagibius litoralis]